VGTAAGERKGKTAAMHRFRSSLFSLGLSILLTLLSAAVALAEGQPPVPR
jgi:hypothetical protein